MSNSLADKLQQLGFSTNEIKLLIHLYYQSKPVQADELAEAVGVPLSRTYEALDSLASQNFIVVHGNRPRQYVAQDPKIAIQHFLTMKEEKMQQEYNQTSNIADTVLELSNDLYLEHHTRIEPAELLQQFSSLDAAENSTVELIENAQDEIWIFTHVFQWYFKIKEQLHQAIDRGCEVKILMQQPMEDAPQKIPIEKLRDKGVEVKTITESSTRARGTIIDKEKLIFVIWADDGDKSDQRIYRPQFSSNPGIVEVFTGYFTHLWQS